MTMIALCGKAGSGKSTVAGYMAERYGAQRHAFAWPLKRMAKDLWGFTDEQVFGDAVIKETVDPRWGITPRVAMQTLGESARQHLGKGIWIDALIEHLAPLDGLHVIEDLRHRNEAQAVYEFGGFVIRLHYAGSKSSAEYGNHPSETEVDLISPSILAADIYSVEKSLPQLFSTIDGVMRGLLFR